jgi:hypothetical protein
LIWRAGEAEKIAGEYARLRPLGLLVGAHVLPVLSSSATVRVSPACEVHPYGFAREEINTGVADPKVRARLVEWAVPFASSPSDFAKFFADDIAKRAKVIRDANIKPR